MDILDELINFDDFVENEDWEQHHYNANKEIIKQGDNSVSLYYLKKGAVRVLGTVDVGDNRKVHPGVYDIKSGEVFGELVLIDHEPRSATVVCLEECDIVTIDGQKLMQYLEQHPEFGFRFMREMMGILIQRLRSTNKKLFSLFTWGLKAHKIDKYID